MRHCVVSTVALSAGPAQLASASTMKSDLESGVSGIEILPVGITQGPMSVDFWVITVSEPGAKTPESGRRRVKAEKATIVGLKKRA